MSKRLTKMDIHSIKEMKEAGMSVTDIAFVVERSEPTIYAVLKGEHTNQDRIADRMEHFLGGATADSGCYEKEFYHDEDRGMVVKDVDVGENMDPTFETVAFEEELENMLEELEKN